MTMIATAAGQPILPTYWTTSRAEVISPAGRSLPSYRLLNLRYGVRFEPQDMDKVQPVPAGLLGPIQLVVSKTDGS